MGITPIQVILEKKVNTMNFQLSKDKDKKLIERLNSYQFKLSQEILGKRISLNLERDEAAKIAGLSLKQYTEFEQGIDLSGSQSAYQQVLDKLITYEVHNFKAKVKLSPLFKTLIPPVNELQISSFINSSKQYAN